jgi:hypothetical protein
VVSGIGEKRVVMIETAGRQNDRLVKGRSRCRDGEKRHKSRKIRQLYPNTKSVVLSLDLGW